MPGFDGTGPVGYGPMTGRGLGFCNPRAGAALPYYGRGFGWGRGRGRGFRRGGWGFGRGWAYPAAPPAYGSYAAPAYGAPYGMGPQEEATYLKEEAAAIRDELEAIQRRINELESKESSSE
ncbi:MAG: DUF5320 domain-containing protein [Desulfobacteraceae bacterium]